VGVAGIRGPGKYSGVVVFDRWGGCTLYGGVYVMYVAEAVKEQLRAEAGKSVEVDATEVWQPHNPGDGLIKKFTLLGAAKEGTDSVKMTGLAVRARAAFRDGETPVFVIRVENQSAVAAATVYMDALAPTLLAKKSERYWGPADGPSEAVVTRSAFWVGEEMRMKGGNETWGWTVKSPDKLEREVVIPAKGSFEIELTFAVPEGEYEFLAGYGGGVQNAACVASNLVAFDVGKEGKGTVVKVAAR
jgi:hypothetical protein